MNRITVYFNCIVDNSRAVKYRVTVLVSTSSLNDQKHSLQVGALRSSVGKAGLPEKVGCLSG